MSHIRLEEEIEVYDVPWVDIITLCVILSLVFLKFFK